MIQSECGTRGPGGLSAIHHALFLALAVSTSGCNRDEPQTSTATPAPATIPATTPQPVAPNATPAAKPLTELESLVAPVALYPDPLLAELLVASTYPLEVVQAARWLDTQPDLATLHTKDWDASIMRLASVPQVVKMMSDHLDWTTQLGDAFLAKPAELMDAIQALRKRATDAGFLKDTAEQKVSVKPVSVTPTETAGQEGATGQATPAVYKKEVIAIAPAKDDAIYVPQYNPETVYQAPLAAPPGTTSYPATTAGYAAPAYYPAYYPPPATTTTTTSTNDSLINFGTGALVGGLLTWGIMEWADDDDHYYGGGYYPVGHYYGGSVCNGGNCWQGGYQGNRGNVNRNTNINTDRDINISGNEINIDRGGVFSQDKLRPAQRPADWQPNAQHRRGRDYPKGAQDRLGRIQPPALAGQRLGSAQTLPASARGFADGRPATRPADRRPSSAEIQQRLAQKPGDKLARPSTRDIPGQAGQGMRENALSGLKDSGAATQLDSRRGAESRRQAPSGNREIRNREAGTADRRRDPQTNQSRRPERQPQVAQRPQGAGMQGRAGGDRSRPMDTQRRAQPTRPNAFEGGRDARTAQSFSQRGAASRNAGTRNFSGGGAAAKRGGGGGGAHSGGGRRR